jgi:anti-sigma-K factor RskA
MEKDIRLIEDFLFDLLSNEDKKAFQKRLESDKAFREKFEFEKQLFSSLNENTWNFGDAKHPKVKEYKSVLDSNELSELK